jgi:hypothetical protein
MRNLNNLDSKKSIQFKKLIFTENDTDALGRLLSYVMFSGFFLIPSLLILNFITDNDISYFAILPFLIMILGLRGLYCQFTEMNLKEIRTNIQPEEIKKRIRAYSRGKNYSVHEAADHLLFLNKPTYEGFSDYEETTFIFISEGKILYTLLKETTRFNTPVLFAQYFKARDLKRILR